MNFHLNYNPAPSLTKISHNDKIMLIGSCFAENIGNKLKEHKFQTLVNPNGILFNPISIAEAVHSYIKPGKYELRHGVNNGLHFSFDHHGSFSYTSKEVLEKEVKASVQNAHEFLKQAKYLIITLGSAYVYRQVLSGNVVANCHKLPQQNFMKDLLKVDDITSAYTTLINDLRNFNPGLKIIFTVSPVKYLRDGLIENNLSKSILIQSTHLLSANHELPTRNCSYFPAYELVTDDLRDYRFYKEDMAHPNEQAINYIWEKFADTCFNEATKQTNEKISEITKAAAHRPIHETSEIHSKFKTIYFKKCEALEKEYPGIDLKKEKEIFT